MSWTRNVINYEEHTFHLRPAHVRTSLILKRYPVIRGISNEEENYIMIAIWTGMMTIDKDDDKDIEQG